MITGIKKQNKITEITFDEKDNRIFICTYNTDLKNRLTKYAEKYPGYCTKTDDDEMGKMSFEILKSRFSFRLTAPYDEKRRQIAKAEMQKINKNTGGLV